jgi:Zn-finger protein
MDCGMVECGMVNMQDIHGIRRAGSRNVVEMHGSLWRTCCYQCNYIEVNLGPSPFVISAGSCSFSYCPFAALWGQSFQIIWSLITGRSGVLVSFCTNFFILMHDSLYLELLATTEIYFNKCNGRRVHKYKAMWDTNYLRSNRCASALDWNA